jgi:hypothetical protein
VKKLGGQLPVLIPDTVIMHGCPERTFPIANKKDQTNQYIKQQNHEEYNPIPLDYFQIALEKGDACTINIGRNGPRSFRAIYLGKKGNATHFAYSHPYSDETAKRAITHLYPVSQTDRPTKPQSEPIQQVQTAETKVNENITPDPTDIQPTFMTDDELLFMSDDDLRYIDNISPWRTLIADAHKDFDNILVPNDLPLIEQMSTTPNQFLQHPLPDILFSQRMQGEDNSKFRYA